MEILREMVKSVLKNIVYRYVYLIKTSGFTCSCIAVRKGTGVRTNVCGDHHQ